MLAWRTIMAHPGFFVLNRHWRVSTSDGLTSFQDSESKLRLTEEHGGILLIEGPRWDRCYMPKFSLAGKTVLDVGAGCGETAWFYFSRGASKVICIEPNKERAGLLKENAERNGWNAEIIVDSFKVEHLSIPHAFMKMDCEGGEEALLDDWVNHLGPCRMELHGQALTNSLSRKFGLTRVYRDIWGSDV
jgi:hypothetical protein